MGEVRSPKGRSFKVALDLVTTGLMLVASVALIWASLVSIRGSDTRSNPTRPQSYKEGDLLEIPGLNLLGSQTLILFLRSQCQYCTDSMGFYRRLGDAQRKTRVVVLGYEPEDVLRTYLDAHAVRVDQTVSVTPKGLKFRGTPTLMLVGPAGIIRRVWFGKLPSLADESEIIELVR
jgi:hypothetical protein